MNIPSLLLPRCMIFYSLVSTSCLIGYISEILDLERFVIAELTLEVTQGTSSQPLGDDIRRPSRTVRAWPNCRNRAITSPLNERVPSVRSAHGDDDRLRPTSLGG